MRDGVEVSKTRQASTHRVPELMATSCGKGETAALGQPVGTLADSC